MLSTGESTKTCPNCNKQFITSKYNKKYCSKECCTEITNKAILERYHENKKNKGIKRSCRTCSAHLSIYNEDDICTLCSRREKDVQRVGLLKELGFFDYVQE